MKKGDKILFIVLMIIGVTGCIIMAVLSGKASYVTVVADGVAIGSYPMNTDREIIIETENGGENVLQIADGHVKMISANCPNLDCVHHNAISSHNESIVCLPHKLVVMLYVPGDNEASDAVTW